MMRLTTEEWIPIPVEMSAATKIVARAHVGKTPWFVMTREELLIAADGMPNGIREAFIARVEREFPNADCT